MSQKSSTVNDGDDSTIMMALDDFCVVDSSDSNERNPALVTRMNESSSSIPFADSPEPSQKAKVTTVSAPIGLLEKDSNEF